MKRVLASGVFDVIHPGHVAYLEGAKAFGDHLVVVVTSDGHAARSKRPPLHNAKDRARTISALRFVDEVVIGADPYDLAATVETTRPDIIVLGYDQAFDEEALKTALNDHGLVVEVRRLPHLEAAQSTSEIIRSLE